MTTRTQVVRTTIADPAMPVKNMTSKTRIANMPTTIATIVFLICNCFQMRAGILPVCGRDVRERPVGKMGMAGRAGGRRPDTIDSIRCEAFR